MDPHPVIVSGFNSNRSEPDENGFEFLQFREEIQRLMTVPPENASSFTALLELPATKAMELLHSPHSDNGSPAPLSGDPLHRIDDDSKPYLPSVNGHLTFPSNKALIERVAKLSVFSAGEHSPETSSVPSNSSANLEKVKSEPADTDSNPDSSQPLVSDPTVENKTQRPTKRKEREKKVKFIGFLGFSDHSFFCSNLNEPLAFCFQLGQRVLEEEQERKLSRRREASLRSRPSSSRSSHRQP